MITIKSEKEIELMREACRIANLAQKAIEAEIKPGMTTLDLDRIAEKAMRDNGAIPAEKGYPSGIKGVMDFPGSICASVNDEVIHGIPSKKVVSQGLAKPAGSKQFSVAGKTGTAQVSQGTAGYKNGRVNYLVSFCGYFPADAPKYSCIVSIQKPGLPASGGLMAGSVFGKIAERVYAKNLRFDIRSAIDSTSNVIPPVKAGEMNEAFQVLNSLKVPVQKQFTSKKGQEVWGHTQAAPNAVVLQGKDGANPDLVPSVIGMGAKDAVYLLESKGLKVRLNGIGKVRNQSIPGGNRVVKGQTVTLALH